MSGAGNWPGPPGWIWNEQLQDFCWRNPSTGQVFVSNRGNPRPVHVPLAQDPRSGQPISRTEIRDNSQPNIAGSPPDDPAYSIWRGNSRQSSSSNFAQGQQIPFSRSVNQSGPRGEDSAHSTSPPSSTLGENRADVIRRSHAFQGPSQVSGDRNNIEPRPRGSHKEGKRPMPVTESTSSNPYSPQASSFVPSSSPPDDMQSNLPGLMGGLSVRPEQGSGYRNSNSARDDVDENGVRSFVRLGNVPTDPSLQRYNVKTHMHLLGTDSEVEALYPDFKRRPTKKFFHSRQDQVFMILWAEPAGDSAKSNTLITSQQQSTIPGRYGELVFSKVRRFIVIRESDDYCSALSIVSYGSQGAGKPGVAKHEHGIVHTGRQAPQPAPQELPRRQERGMVPTAVRVDPDQKTEKLTPMSRINYGKVYTVEHNVKVKTLGTVNKDSLQALIYQFKAVWNPGYSRQSGTMSIPAQGPSGTPQDTSSRGPGNYANALQYLTSQSWPPDQAAAMLRGGATSGTTRPSEREDDAASSDDNEEDAGAESSSSVHIRKAARHLQMASGLSLEEATAVVRRSLKARAQSKDDPDEESNEEGSDSDDKNQKAAKKKQLAEARTRQFLNAVAALHQQGVSYEEAYRSIYASMFRGGSQTAASASQRGSTGRRPTERDNEDEEDSSEESSEGDEEEDA